jgi:hypothetical protein
MRVQEQLRRRLLSRTLSENWIWQWWAEEGLRTRAFLTVCIRRNRRTATKDDGL